MRSLKGDKSSEPQSKAKQSKIKAILDDLDMYYSMKISLNNNLLGQTNKNYFISLLWAVGSTCFFEVFIVISIFLIMLIYCATLKSSWKFIPVTEAHPSSNTVCSFSTSFTLQGLTCHINIMSWITCES